MAEQNRNEFLFDCLTVAVMALTLPVSIVISPRLGYSHPWVLVSGWACYAVAAALGVLRLRLALRNTNPDAANRARDLWFRVLTVIFLAGLALNGFHLASNLYLNYLDQEANAQAGDDSCQLQT